MKAPKFKSKLTDLVAVYEIVRRLATPFVETEAYELGLIDKNGNYLKRRSQMSSEEKKAFTRFDMLIFKLKRLLAKLPGGDSKFRNFAAAMWLLKEDYNYGFVADEDVIQLAEELDFAETRTINEMMDEEIAVSIGSGAVDNSIAPVKKKDQVKYSSFGKCRVYEVDNTTFNRCRMEKTRYERFSKHLGSDSPILGHVTDYARSNPGRSIMISDKTTGAMQMLKLGSKEKW